MRQILAWKPVEPHVADRVTVREGVQVGRMA